MSTKKRPYWHSPASAALRPRIYSFMAWTINGGGLVGVLIWFKEPWIAYLLLGLLLTASSLLGGLAQLDRFAVRWFRSTPLVDEVRFDLLLKSIVAFMLGMLMFVLAYAEGTKALP